MPPPIRALPKLTQCRRLTRDGNVAQIQTDSQVLGSIKEFLSSCPTERYLLASQPNVHAADLRGCSSTPHLCRALSDETVSGQFRVAEVVGKIDIDSLTSLVKKACADRSIAVDVRELKLSPLPRQQSRAEVLSDNGMASKAAALVERY